MSRFSPVKCNIFDYAGSIFVKEYCLKLDRKSLIFICGNNLLDSMGIGSVMARKITIMK